MIEYRGLRQMTVLVVTVSILTLASLYYASNLGFDDEYGALFRSNDQHGFTLQQLAEQFDSGEQTCIILFESPDVLSAPSLLATSAIHKTVSGLNSVEQVTSLHSARRQKRIGRYLLPLVSSADLATEASRQDLIAEVAEHPLVAGRIVSTDRSAAIMTVQLKAEVRDLDDVQAAIHQIDQIVDDQLRGTNISAGITGLPAIRVDTISSIQRDNLVISVAGITFATLAAWLVLRNLGHVFIVVVPPLAGVVWTLGIMGATGKNLDAINIVLPALLLVIGATDATHLMFHIRRRRSRGESGFQAANSARRELTRACFLTSLTTAIGFGSLAICKDPIIQYFGIYSAIGVALTFASVYTLVPLLGGTVLGKTKPASPTHRSWLHRVIDGWSLIVTRDAQRLAMIACVAAAVVFSAAFRLDTDYRLTENLTWRSEAQKTLKQCEAKFGGIPLLQVVVQWKEKTTANSPRLLDLLCEVHGVIDSSPIATKPISLMNLLESLPGEGSELSSRFRELRYIPKKRLHKIVRPRERTALVVALAPDLGSSELRSPLNEMRRSFRQLEKQYDGYSIHLTGFLPVSTKRSDAMIQDLLRSLAVASLLVLLVTSIAFRSVWFGLASIIPNTLPLAGAGAAMVVWGQPLQYTSALAFSISLGIAVDDTMHFLAKLEQTRASGASMVSAIRDTLKSISPAIATTTLLMLIGFGSTAFSTIPTVQAFGVLSCIAITLALMGDLLVLPVAVAVMFTQQEKSSCQRESLSQPC